MIETDYEPNPTQGVSQAPAPQAEAPVRYEMQSGPLSLDQAAGRMSALLKPDRAQNGQFAPKEKAEVIDINTAKPVETKKPEGKELVGHNGGPEMEEDEFFEWAPEKEGEAPRRVKADEVFAAYEELPKLKAELENVKKATPPPADYVALSGEVMQRRSQLIDQISILEELINPQRPDPRQYQDNPEGYMHAMARYERDVKDLQGVRDAKAKAIKEQEEAQAVVVRAQVARATEEIFGFWPELKDAKARGETLAKLEKLTGFTQNEIVNAVDPRMWRILKGFMEYEAGREKQAEAVKVVRSKPKLVRGAARQPTNTKAAQVSSHMQRLAQSGSVEDAAAALSRLFG